MIRTLLALSLVLCLSFCAHTPETSRPDPWRAESRPHRAIILVFDQLRPDFLKRFDLPNFKRLESHAIDFKNAWVGHLTANTVVSHAVITSGLLPKHLPWSDEIFEDTKGLLGPKGRYQSTLQLSPAQYKKVLGPVSHSLLKHVGGKPETKLVVGQKLYATYAFAVPDNESRVLTLGPVQKNGWRAPVGENLLPLFTEPLLGRFYLNGTRKYGSENSPSPYDGDRFAPGTDPVHSGGDLWVSDAVVSFMKATPDWTAVFATFGSIDKTLHTLAEHDSPTTASWALENKLDLKSTLARADQALGQILDYLEANDLLQDTVLVVTADHGGQFDQHFYGLPESEIGGLLNWNEGKFARAPVPPALLPITKDPSFKAVVRDSALTFYLKPGSREDRMRFASRLRLIPGIASIDYREKVETRYHYVRTFRNPSLSPKELEWAKQHDAPLLESFAGETGPDVVALLQDGYGYGLPGDHGGAQEAVQRIPLILWSPNIRSGDTQAKSEYESSAPRLVDIHPMLGELLHLSPETDLDGSSAGITSRMVEGL